METYQLRHFRQVLGRRYEFQAFLGRGAFASVYLVRNLKLKRREALKILADTFESDSTARFLAEATMVASLDHPNIVQVYDYGEVEGLIWYSMQYIEGPMLRDEILARGRFDSTSAVRIAIPLLGALETSHRRGIVHRDLKPSNVILSRDGRPYLMDFGIAKADDSHLKTMTGCVFGTPAFMAPEQAEGRPLDGRADLYSLGLVLYQMLAGRSPFDTREPMQLLLLRLREDPPRLSSFVPDIDPALEAILMKVLERDRDNRFSSAREWECHLGAFLGDDRELPPFELQAPTFEFLPLDPESRPVLGGLGGRSTPSGATETISNAPALRRLRRLRRGESAAISLILAVVLAGSWLSRRTEPIGPPPGVVAEQPEAVAPRGRGEAGGTKNRPEEALSAAQPPSSAEPVRPLARVPSPPAAAAPAAAAPAESAVPPRAVRPPLLVERVEPVISGDAVALCAGISVVVSIQVGPDGRPVRVRSLGTSPAECRTPAEAAARQFRFDPAEDGQERPVAAAVTIAISFGDIQ